MRNQVWRGGRMDGTEARILTQTYVRNDFVGGTVWRREKAGILRRKNRILSQESMDKRAPA
jgi:hypothetical protein